MNGVELSHNLNPNARYPVCTRVLTGDRCSVPEFFFNASEAEVYAEMAPFTDHAAETMAFNKVRASHYVQEALSWNDKNQKRMALISAAMVDLYTKAGSNYVG